MLIAQLVNDFAIEGTAIYLLPYTCFANLCCGCKPLELFVTGDLPTAEQLAPVIKDW